MKVLQKAIYPSVLSLRRAEGKEAAAFVRIGVAEGNRPRYLDVSEVEGWLRRKLYLV